MNTNYCTMSITSLMRCNHLEPSLSVRDRCSLKRHSIWWAAPPTCCITTNTTNQASASCIPMVTELPQSQGGGDSEVGEKGKQNRGRWRKKRRKRWRGERESIPSLISRWGFKNRGSFPIREGWGGQAGEDWRTADNSECRDGVEGCLGCCSLWDRDLQWPLSLCSVEQLGACGEVFPSARYTSAFFHLYMKNTGFSCRVETCFLCYENTVKLDDGNMDACLLTAHTSPDWGGLGSAGGCCLRWGPQEAF